MKARTWSFISVLLFAAAILSWLAGNERLDQERQRQAVQPAATNPPSPDLAPAQASPGPTAAHRLLSTSIPPAAFARAVQSLAPSPTPAAQAEPTAGARAPHRLANTTQGIGELARKRSAILLRNAFIDTANGQPLPIPAHLRASADPGSYLVQSLGPICEAFRAELAARGATIVSYIPNHTFLVRAEPAVASALSQVQGVGAVLPFEPYYKLDPQLLPLATDRQPLTPNRWLRVTLFPGDREAGLSALSGLARRVHGEDQTPFGPQIVLEPEPDSLVALATLPQVQLVEPYVPRTLMNDLTRVRLGVADSGTNAANHLGLTGSNVWVNVNDTGVDDQHPDLEGRVFGDSPTVLVDLDGHGTHVAGTIASSGANSPSGTNAPGSDPNADFRGMAPAAKLFAMAVDLDTGPLQSDAYLQETAARTNYLTLNRTNALIANNSWGYAAQLDYDSAAASYDAAVRDALLDEPGPQPLLYVFAAGNRGAGNEVGQGGEPGTITSPGTAKNVITVGAIDSFRYLTNEVVRTVNGEPVTNRVFLAQTDSDAEVTPSSSRGNVGIGVEGDFGRFKPDLVAPGAFAVSTRAKDWDVIENPTNRLVVAFTNQVVSPGQRNHYSVLVPADAIRLTIEAVTNRVSAAPFPALPLYVKQWTFPDVTDLLGTGRVVLDNPGEGDWFVDVGNDTLLPVHFDLRITIEVPVLFGDFFQVLKALNDPLKPHYRYASGTSVAAASVSGMLALLEEFFAQQLERAYSPALMKALLINGARSLGPQYSFQIDALVNYQGWGVPNLAATLPTLLTNATQETNWPVRWIDQSATNALATGQSHTYDLSVPPEARQSDLKVTLVWTDPPGNPAAAIKLVNNLDLVVSNKVTGEVYAGNFIPEASNYNEPAPTNGLPTFDTVNNVENVFLRRPIGTNYTVQVVGRRVNVNTVTAHPDGIVQDYALVVSVSATNALGFTQLTETNRLPAELTTVTNGIPLLYQRVGANSPLQKDPVGLTNQWHFYIFTNAYTPGMDVVTNFGPYVAFLTFVPPNLSAPRNEEADIDLYVNRGDPSFLTLDPVALQDAISARKRGGTEQVVFTNGAPGEVFYIGVKAEDQMASEYGFVGLSSDEPFEFTDPFGNRVLRGFPTSVAIPDGSPIRPGAGLVFAIGIEPIDVGNVIVSNTIVHQELGDLFGNLRHGTAFAVLNNHALVDGVTDGVYSFLYDDSRSGEFPYARSTDGPGSLLDFIGSQGNGPWILTMVDNALSHTGWVQDLTVRITPNPDLLTGTFGSVLANQFKYYFIDVPADASQMTVLLSSMTGPLNLYVRRDAPPTLTDYDKVAFLAPPGGQLSIGVTDVPPLRAGRYYIGVYNPTAVTVDFFIQVRLERNLPDAFRRVAATTNAVVVGDDVRTWSTNVIDDTRLVTDVKVGLRVDHPRVSDLDFHLVSPTGQRVLVYENRGGSNRTQLGFQTVTTNFHHVALTYSANSGEAALYLDGELQVERDLGSFTPDTRDSLYLGRRPLTNQVTQWLGYLDEVDLYNRVLTGSEIRGIYKFGGAGKPTNNLVSRWPFDGNGDDLMTNNPAQVLGPAFVPGRFGQGLKYARDGDHVLITNQAGLNVGASPGFTFDAWVSPTDLSIERPIATWTDGTNRLGIELAILPGTDTNLPPGLLAARLVDVNGVQHTITALDQGRFRTNAIRTNIVYTTFTENTNLAAIPIKFASPATNGDPTLTNRYLSGFEGVNANLTSDFIELDTFDNWLVTSNWVTVLNAPVLAHTGTNLLVLRRGHLTRTLPTLAGRPYRLEIVHRQQPSPAGMISWWPGEGNAADIVSTNAGVEVGTVQYAPGRVGRGFLFETNAGYLEIPANASLDLTNEITLELWFRLTNAATLGGGLIGKLEDPAQANPPRANYVLSASSAGLDLWFNDPTVSSPLSDAPATGYELLRRQPLPTLNVFHHLAGTLKQVAPFQVELNLYLDGALVRSKVLPGNLTNAVHALPLLLGATIPGGDGLNGLLDEVTLYQQVLTPAQIADIHALNAVGKCPPPCRPQVRAILDTVVSNTFNPDLLWQTNTLTFHAPTNGTVLTLQGLQPGALLDSISLTALDDTFFLPEETLKPFLGQSAAGDWRLEVIDRRTGITNAIDPELISWQLELSFAPLVFPAVTLTNGLPYTNTIPVGEARYFIVEVPRSATRATNSLTSRTNLSLWFNQNGLPFGDVAAGDYLLLTNTMAGRAVIATNGTFLVDTNGVPITVTNVAPQLQPGQRYYLSLTNDTAVTQFVLRVDFDALDTNVFGLTPLGYNQTIVTNIAVTNALHYYRYTVSSNAVSASFEVYPTNGNVNLYLRKARPIPDPLPTPRVFDYASENTGTNAEVIVVSQDSIVPLGAGDWYLGVLNADTVPVGYRIRVVESTTNQVVFRQLLAGVPQTAVVAPGADINLYFFFNVAGSPPVVQFDLYGLGGRADLLVGLNSPPTYAGYTALDPASPAAPARIRMRPNPALPSLRGDWYLAIANHEGFGLPFTVQASLPAPGPTVRDLLAGLPIVATLAADTAGLPPALDYYRFNVAADATNVTFAVTPVDGNVDLLLRKNLPLPDLGLFDYASAQLGLAPDAIVLGLGSVPVPLSGGDWYLGVVNQAPNSVTYQVRVAQERGSLGPQIVINPQLLLTAGQVSFTWEAPAGLEFRVEYTERLTPNGPIDWIALPRVLTSSSGVYRFDDSGADTGGFTRTRFYRLVLVP